MGRCTRRAGAVLTIAMTVMGLGLVRVVPAAAQDGWSAADAAALKGYTLTMDKLQRANKVMIDYDRLEADRPDLDDEGEGTQSISGMVKRIEAVPEARTILGRHGLTARDYVMILFTSTQVAAAAYMEENGQAATGLPVSAAQVAFYKAHKAELDELSAQRKAASAEPDESEDVEE
jgi:hypothetical protein